MRLARVATVVAGAAAAYGVRAWRQNREGKDIWAGATDGLPARERPTRPVEEDVRGPEETPQG